MIETITGYIANYFREFYFLFAEMAPYLLLGFVIAGILHVFVPQSFIHKHLSGRGFWPALKAALVGIPLPLCSCGVIPTGVSLHKNGASKSAAVSFLIATPQTGVDSIMITYSLMNLPFAIIRPFVALFTGVLGGVITPDDQKAKTIPPEIAQPADEKVSLKSKLKKAWNYAFVDFLDDIAKWLFIGLVLAALMAVVIPSDFFGQHIQNNYLEMLIILLASIPLYVCATGSVPIAAVLLAKGLSPGAALVFLMAGPATNMATITVIGKSMGRKTLAAYMSSIILGALFFGVIINNFLPQSWFSILNSANIEHQHDSFSWLKTVSALFLAVLLLLSLYRKVVSKYTNNIISVKINEMEKLIRVKGMTCKHCKANVEKNLAKIDGIEFVEANIENNQVKISGQNINLEQIAKQVEDLGYDYQGEYL